MLLLNENLVLYPKKTDSSYQANMALASDRLKEAFDLILAHFTQKVSPDLLDKVINKGKQQFSHIQFDADEIDMFLSISKKLISQERTTLRKLNKIESNLNSTAVKVGI